MSYMKMLLYAASDSIYFHIHQLLAFIIQQKAKKILKTYSDFEMCLFSTSINKIIHLKY